MLQIVFLFFPQRSHALTPITLSAGVEKYHVGPYLELLEDKNRRWTFEQIRSKEFDNRFYKNSEEVPNFGFTSSAFWIRFELLNEQSVKRDWLLEVGYPMLDYIELYVGQENGKFVRKIAGDRYPFHMREFKHRGFIFSLATAPHERKQLYLRVLTSSSMQLPITLRSRKAFIRYDHEEQLLIGIFYGIMLVMTLYNFFIFFAVRDRSYLYYVIYISATILFQLSLNGLAFEYLWPNAIGWANVCVPFFISLTCGMAVVFTRSMLNTKVTAPRIDTVLMGNIALGLMAMLISLFANYPTSIRVAVGFTLLSLGTVVYTAVRSFKMGYRPARFFMLAWITLFVGVAMQSLKAIGILPSTFITDYGMQIGSSLEVILLSFALADRINVITLEKNEAQAQALQIQLQATETLEKEVEQKTHVLQEKNKQLEELDQYKMRFFQNISHELRTPLTILINHIRQMIEACEQNGSHQDWQSKLASMDRNTHRLLRMVNQLLDLSSIEAGAIQVLYVECDIRKIAEAIVESFEPFARSKGLNLELRGAEDLPCCYSDPEKIDKILTNLLSNACKFTDSGGSIIVRLSHDNSEVALSVIDSGIGISEMDLNKIFDRFKQVHGEAAPSDEVTGIGLALARELTVAIGGRITVHSEERMGSTFTLFVPLGKSHIKHPSLLKEQTPERDQRAISRAAARALTAEVGSEGAKAANQVDELKERIGQPRADAEKQDGLQRLTILIVEENPDMRSLLAEICKEEFQVIEATDGNHGLELIRQKLPALVISDVNMPGIDGHEFLRQLRSEPIIASIPVILLTSQIGPDMNIQGLEVGADDYIVKPFNSRELLARARNLVKIREQERMLRELNFRLQSEVANQATTVERSHILARYLPPDLVNSIMEGKPLDALQQRRRITVFQSELRGFDEIIHALEPEDLTVMLNGYLSDMMEVASTYGATVDIFLRDRISGFFGAPLSKGVEEDARMCLQMSLEMLKKAKEICNRWRGLLDFDPPEPTILIHSGYATVGNFGSDKRLAYTAIGITVDESTELLRMSKPGGVSCSQTAWKLLGANANGEKDKVVNLGGRSKPMSLFALNSLEELDEKQPSEQREKVELGEVAQNDSLLRPLPYKPDSFPGIHLDECETQELAPGTNLGNRYEIINLIGEGAMALVYKAKDLKLNSTVAVKIMRPEYMEDPKRRTLLARELKLARMVRHHNLAQIFELYEWEGTEYIAMEYIEGITMEERIRKSGAFPIKEGVEVIRQICSGLSAVHSAGVVHRDIKPSNIMIEKNNRAVIMDFGIARWLPSLQDSFAKTKELIGTPCYMSPEQIAGKRVDRRTDIYALGVISFEMLTGSRLFESESAMGFLYQHAHEPPPNPAEKNPAIPSRLAAIILCCLEKTPDARFGSIEEVSSMLEKYED